MFLVLTSCSPADAEPLLAALLEERVVGCGNILPPARSLYWWRGRIEHAEESLLLMEVPDGGLERALRRLKELHPYEVPKILALPVAASDPDYAAWLSSVTGPTPGTGDRLP